MDNLLIYFKIDYLINGYLASKILDLNTNGISQKLIWIWKGRKISSKYISFYFKIILQK